MSFAKIHESVEHGQILVMKDTSEEGDPCVVFVFDPKIEGIEVFKSQFGFDDEEKRNRTFGMATLERSESVVRATLRELELRP
ncbi:MAG: hypothetical protein EOM03_16015 [Clostridia bacterium]|nr:hypothetical protein [Clostridia bacterium]